MDVRHDGRCVQAQCAVKGGRRGREELERGALKKVVGFRLTVRCPFVVIIPHFRQQQSAV
jgi:hypothetical protein